MPCEAGRFAAQGGAPMLVRPYHAGQAALRHGTGCGEGELLGSPQRHPSGGMRTMRAQECMQAGQGSSAEGQAHSCIICAQKLCTRGNLI